MERIGWPGEFPFTRGLYATGYRGRPWTIRQFAGFGNARTFRTVDPEMLIDAQIGYEFQPGSKFAGLSLLLQGQNLSDEPFVTYQSGDTSQVIDYQRFGRRFLFGIGYKFGMNK